MANIHFGRIGDLWKHLPLAEIIAIEQPRQVWETHAGSAQYTLTHSYERDYGVYYFREHGQNSASLASSTYAQILNSLVMQELHVYPGSPSIAMHILRHRNSHFVFCDLDHNSIINIQEIATNLGIVASRIQTIQDDGLICINQLSIEAPAEDTSQILVHIDPYRTLDESAPGLNSFDLFCRLSKRGIKCVLWYGYENLDVQKMLFDGLRHARHGATEVSVASQFEFWCGDIQLAIIRDPSVVVNTGIISCGIITSNLSDQAIAICDQYGKELEKLYATAKLADSRSGAMQYTSFIL
jgi:23S rRNA (adenine2030-N6)-methyltransferase